MNISRSQLLGEGPASLVWLGVRPKRPLTWAKPTPKQRGGAARALPICRDGSLENTLLASRQKSDEARGQDRAAAAAGALTSVDRRDGRGAVGIFFRVEQLRPPRVARG